MQFGIGAVTCERRNPDVISEMPAQLLRAVIDDQRSFKRKTTALYFRKVF